MNVITNGIVLTMEGDVIPCGYVAWENGVICAVGAAQDAPQAKQTIDAHGGYLVPGFVDAHSHIGMWEDSLNEEGDDGNETTDPITPQLRAIDAVNPYDYALTEALAAGVTTVVTGPGSANAIGGQFVAMKTRGRRVDDMVIAAPAAMKMAFGENPKSVYGSKHQAPNTRMGTAALIRETLYAAKEYDEQLRRHAKDSTVDKPDFDLKLESLLPVVRGELLVKAHAHRADDIFTALRIKREFNLNMTIEHGTEGQLIADLLAQEGVGVCVGPFLTDRSKPELAHLSLRTAATLSQAGIPISIICDHPVTPEKFLPLCAAMAVKEGLDSDAALRAITIDAAKLCGIAGRVGSLAVGKDADIVWLDAHPLSLDARVQSVIIGGEVLSPKELLTK